jgi:hypothetical protein
MFRVCRQVSLVIGAEVKFSLCLKFYTMKTYPVTYRAIKAYWEAEVQLHAFLNSALDGGE